MDVAAAVMGMKASSAQVQAQTSVMKMAMDNTSQNAEMLVDMMMQQQQQQRSVSPPGLGQNIDVYA